MIMYLRSTTHFSDNLSLITAGFCRTPCNTVSDFSLYIRVKAYHIRKALHSEFLFVMILQNSVTSSIPEFVVVRLFPLT